MDGGGIKHNLEQLSGILDDSNCCLRTSEKEREAERKNILKTYEKLRETAMEVGIDVSQYDYVVYGNDRAA